MRLKCLYMIKPMVVDLWVDAHIYHFFEKSYKWVWSVRTLSQFQGSEMSLGLFQDFMDGYIKFLRLPPSLSQPRVPIRGPSSNPMSSQFPITTL